MMPEDDFHQQVSKVAMFILLRTLRSNRFLSMFITPLTRIPCWDQ